MWDSAIPESYEDELRVKNRKALLEDIEHLYFICLGILICAVSNWQAAVGAAIATLFIRDIIRTIERWWKMR